MLFRLDGDGFQMGQSVKRLSIQFASDLPELRSPTENAPSLPKGQKLRCLDKIFGSEKAILA